MNVFISFMGTCPSCECLVELKASHTGEPKDGPPTEGVWWDPAKRSATCPHCWFLVILTRVEHK